jgi:cell division septation protein DedD
MCRRARWFRAAVVFSVAGVAASLAVPYVLSPASHAARRMGGWQEGVRATVRGGVPWGPVANTVEVVPAGGVFGAPDARSLRFREVAATAPTPPRQARHAPREKSLQTSPTGNASAGIYWVQVGAYRDAETAKLVAQRLREQQYQVHESAITRAGSTDAVSTAAVAPINQGERERYEIVVTGAAPGEVEARLRAKGVTSRAAPEGAVVTPGLPLGEAVALSKDLADDGLSVRVRRMGTAAAAPRVQASVTRETFYRVRVGGFADRAAAVAALKDLESRGYKPFLARGSE